VGKEIDKKLIEAFNSRNIETRRFPDLAESRVLLVPYARLQESLKQRGRETVGYSAFSLPGYSEDRHAMVYGFYTCGGRCGTGWLFILSRTTGGWQVEAAYGIWQS
jgi:hypothetical protein